MFKVFINDGKEEMPQDDIMYIIGKGGIFLKKKLDLIESIAKVNEIDVLEPVEQYVNMNIPGIPVYLVRQTLAFFQYAYEKYSSEAMVLIYYNQSNSTYLIKAPEQTVTGASIRYENDGSPLGYNVIGTIHSHGSMSAFHSGVDIQDEKSFDGLHITFGNINDKNNKITISSSIVANGFRTVVPVIKYLKGVIPDREKTNTLRDYSGKTITLSNAYEKWIVKNYNGFVSFPEEWKLKISIPTGRTRKRGYYMFDNDDNDIPGFEGYVIKDFDMIRSLMEETGKRNNRVEVDRVRYCDSYNKNKMVYDEFYDPCENCKHYEFAVEKFISEYWDIEEDVADGLPIEDVEETEEKK